MFMVAEVYLLRKLGWYWLKNKVLPFYKLIVALMNNVLIHKVQTD